MPLLAMATDDGSRLSSPPGNTPGSLLFRASRGLDNGVNHKGFRILAQFLVCYHPGCPLISLLALPIFA